MKRAPLKSEAGYWLLEALLAVTIFAIGIIALGQSVNNCIVAEHVKDDDVRARLALGNRMVEIEAGSVQLRDTASEELKGAFEGMTLKQTREPVKRKNEKDQDIVGIYAVTLVLSWKADGQELSRELSFNVSSQKAPLR